MSCRVCGVCRAKSVQKLGDVLEGVVVAELELELRGGEVAGLVHGDGHGAGDDVVVLPDADTLRA